MATPRPIVKIASDAWEFDEIHRLNHKTFAEEIPQHEPDASARLVDAFHRENTYVVAIQHARIAGMLAIRGTRPFSLDRKLADLDAWLPGDRSMCELRLLAVDQAHRSTALLADLLSLAWRHIVEKGYDLAIISAYLGQLKLYEHLGFEPFGPRVGPRPEVQFQPMMLTLERFAHRAPRSFRRGPNTSGSAACLLPGPVAVDVDVLRAFGGQPRSHRLREFTTELNGVKQSLCRLTGARYAQVLVGSGTLANDVVAAQLSLEPGPGLILTNGEFGERLVHHARRAGLDFDTIAIEWGQPVDLDTVEARCRDNAPRWLWCVHCETSTGVLNDLDRIGRICRSFGIRLCVDAVSSVGTTAVDLRGAHLASASSGKGLGAYPGLAIVFHDHDVNPSASRLPRVLDLGLYVQQGVPFTHSSNLVAALAAALARPGQDGRLDDMAREASWLRLRLARLGFEVVGAGGVPAPGVVTVALPIDVSSVEVAHALDARGFQVGAFSSHLIARNWLQIALMGRPSRAVLSMLSVVLLEVTDSARHRASPLGLRRA